MTTTNSAPLISDYAYIGDCHSGALVSKQGSIDWCCMPRLDSASCFGRLLDWEKAGYCQIAPTEPYQVTRGYFDHSMILETHFQTNSGEVRLIDLLTMHSGGSEEPYRQILRIIEWVQGTVTLKIDVVPRFDYGAIKPWMQQYEDHSFIAMGGCDGLLIYSQVPLVLEDRHQLSGLITVNSEQRIHLSITYAKPETLGEGMIDIPTIQNLERRFEETNHWWEIWSQQGQITGPYRDLALRSAMVLKCLSNAPTGAIAAAATTSLPESPGGSRNWDYRFSWVRDSCFSVRALAELGFINEADGFRKFIERSCAGSVEELQILFGIDGQRHLYERTLDNLSGYRGAKPVRIGNAAHNQIQLDVYGELLALAWNWHERGHSPDDDYWFFLEEIVNATQKVWQNPDQGIWEMRGEPRHFVFSKAMCWLALDRGIKLAIDLKQDADVKKWQATRDDIRKTIEDKGYDTKRGVFTQAFGFSDMDASLLLLPFFGFVDYKDERMIRTVDAVREQLEDNGLLLRYPNESDQMTGGKEGTFLACSFWLVVCLAKQDRHEEALKVFKQAIATGNDLGLFSEEYDTDNNQMLGNFPQGLTHLSIIAAIITLNSDYKSSNNS